MRQGYETSGLDAKNINTHKRSLPYADERENAHHNLDDVDSEMFVHHGAQSDRSPPKQLDEIREGRVQDEFYIVLEYEAMDRGG